VVLDGLESSRRLVGISSLLIRPHGADRVMATTYVFVRLPVALCPAARFDIVAESVPLLLQELLEWYRTETKAGRKLPSKVKQLTPHHFGKQDNPQLKLAGSETNGVLLFAVDCLDRHKSKLDQSLVSLLEVGLHSLNGMYLLISEHPKRFPAAAAQEFCDLVKQHFHAVRQLNAPWIPKYHQLVDMASMIMSHGSPALWANWVDEGINSSLKGVSSAAHKLVWHARVLKSFYDGVGLGAKPEKRKYKTINV